MNPLPYLTVGLSIMLACIMTFGVSAPVLNFSYLSFCVFSTAFIAYSRDSQTEKVACWGVFSLFLLLCFLQLPSLAVFGAFLPFITSMSVFLVSVAIVSTVLSTSALYRIDSVDPLPGRKVYLVIKRPKSCIDYLISTAGNPVSSVSFCIGDQWVAFKQDNRCAKIRGLDQRDGYAFIDSGIIATDGQYNSFMTTIGKKWSIGENCVNSWDFTNGTYLEPYPWEILPTQYVKRVIGGLKS